MSEKSSVDIRDEVSGAYSEALKRASEGKGGCCGPRATEPVGVAAKLVDYGADVADLPEQAVQSSFGCGNPLAFSGVKEGETVVDLGSGAGLDLLVAARKVGPSGRVIGIDMNDDMLEAARKNVAEASVTNIELRRGIIEKLPVEDGSVDWIISNCVINLSPEKEIVFREIERVLKPGGRFSISDIVAEDLPEALREQATVYSACIGGAISESEYRSGLESAGLTEVEVDERIVYNAEDLRGMVGSDLQNAGFPADLLDEGVKAADGKVWSVRIRGQKPVEIS